MNYQINIDIISRSELDEIREFFEPESKKSEFNKFGYFNGANGTWEGAYAFNVEFEGGFAQGKFKRTSQDTYQGTLIANLPAVLEHEFARVAEKMAPSLADKIRKCSTEK